MSEGRDGRLTYVERDPFVLEFHDHIYVPQGDPTCHPGIYDFGGKIVHQSAYSRGPVPSDVLPTKSLPISYSDVSRSSESGSYIYLGAIYSHFGHFLISTISRLWQIYDLPDYPILCYGADLDRLDKNYLEIFAAFGVNLSRLTTLRDICKIERLIVPCPCIEEKNFVHRIFGKAYKSAGDKLAKQSNFTVAGDKPIYLSKSKLGRGVRTILNEDVIEDDLAQAGFAIIHPETLPICDQVALWRLGRPVVSFSGSGLHTAAFSQGAEIFNLRWDSTVDTTFPLIDWACKHQAHYLHFDPNPFLNLGPSPDFSSTEGFSSRLSAFDPHHVAKAIRDLIA